MHLNLFLSSLVASSILPVWAEVDIVRSGNFRIQSCDSAQTESNASLLQNLLPQIRNNLQAVIKDAQLGTSSKRGFAAFFKTQDSVAQVAHVFSQIEASTDLSVVSASGQKAPPAFICANDVLETKDLYSQCTTDHPDTPLVQQPNSANIAICPSFWQEKKAVEGQTDCPRLKDSKLSPNSALLASNQEVLIVRELAQLYLGTTEAANEVHNIQDAVNLNEQASLANADSYALYYAAVQAGCSKWPKAEAPATPPEAFHLEIRDTCASWSQPPNSSVCCDKNTGLWSTPDILREQEPSPENLFCDAPQFVTISSDGSPEYHDAPAPAAPAANTVANAQANYCNIDMQISVTSTVCCDPTTGQWKPSGAVQRDGAESTKKMSAACPDLNSGADAILF